jgi:uncharacterized damage-inducible protein DinB
MTEWIDEAFRGPAWHGPALLSAIRGVTPRQALWRPARGRHNIAEIVVHAAYWKHVVRGRLGGGRGRFPLRGRNWFVCADAGDWTRAAELLRDEHARLRDVVSRLSSAAWRRTVTKGQTAAGNVFGVAAHDIYHAGQIRLLRKLSHES